MKLCRTITVILALVLAALPIFINLDVLPVRLFDESRLAVNAYEMYRDGDLIVTHFEEEPDMWNTKPPLMVWLQVLFMKFIGANEWAIRLPAALAAFLTCILLLNVLLKYVKDPLPGLISVLVLVTSLGFMEQHCVRTGDYDALMTLFIFIYGIAFFNFIETGREKYLYQTFLFISLAILTKGVAGLMMLPGMALYALARKKVLPILKSKHFYLGFLMMAILGGWYYLVREIRNPGFLEAMANNELWGRYLQPVEQQHKGYGYYFDEMGRLYFKHWILWLLPAFVAGLFNQNKAVRRLLIFSAMMGLMFLAVITFSMTKHYWYPMPMYPFLALIMGIGIFTVIKRINGFGFFQRRWLSVVVTVAIIVAIFYEPYRQIITKHIKAEEYGWEAERYYHTYYLRDALKGKYNLNGVEYVTVNYRANAWFYIYRLQDSGVDIKKSRGIDEADFSGKVMAFEQEVKDHIYENYTFDVTDTFHNVVLFNIHGKK